MHSDGVSKVWYSTSPKVWPKPPSTMTFSRLLDIEACPRRWALSSADYPEIWTHRGYPDRPRIEKLIGGVVHYAIELITKALVRANCSSLQDPKTIYVLKEMGGYTQIINNCLVQILSGYEENPRAYHILPTLMRIIHSRIADMRVRVQILLSKVNLNPVSNKKQDHKFNSDHKKPLNIGSHAEIKLKADDLGWIGIADLINISDSQCEIVDFKTGNPDEKHILQLQIYNLLWMYDTEFNPSSRPVTRLTILYINESVNVTPLLPEEIQAFKTEVVKRTRLALSSLENRTPQARPNLKNCQFCGVRQLCSEYWDIRTQASLAQENDTSTEFNDIEVTIMGRRGPLSWDATVEVSRNLSRCPQQIVIQTSTDKPIIKVGSRVRILGAHFSCIGEGNAQTVVANVGNASEIFLVI